MAIHSQKLFISSHTTIHLSVYAAGEGLDFTGEPLIREESVEVDASVDGTSDATGNQGQAEEQQEKGPSTEQQTQESEVQDFLLLIQSNSLFHWLRVADQYNLLIL